MGNFKYDIVTLIELVESKPCIWDKTNEHNKNKILRNKSWQEIFSYLEDGYEELSQGEKKKIGDNIMAKWHNIRDSFLRSLRTKSNQGAKKSYIYGKHLQFLLKTAQKDDTERNFSQVLTEDDSIVVEDLTDSQPSTTPSRSQPKSMSQALSTPLPNRSTKRENQSRSKRQLDDKEREILSELKRKKKSANDPLNVKNEGNLNLHLDSLNSTSITSATADAPLVPPFFHAEDKRDEAQIYAEGWATSYRKLSKMQRIMARKAIEEIFFLGELEQLTSASVHMPSS